MMSRSQNNLSKVSKNCIVHDTKRLKVFSSLGICLTCDMVLGQRTRHNIMGDQGPKTELPRDVLAPSESIRNDLVTTAVKFLQNPKVQDSSLGQKKAFLQKKGLTPEEIDAAVARAGIQQQDIATTVQTHAGYQDKLQISSAATVPIRQAELSTLAKAKHIAASVTIVTGLSFAAYKIYQEFIRPWLFGLPTPEKRIKALERNVEEVLSSVTASLSSIQQKLESQQEKLQMLSHDINSKESGDSIAALQDNASLREIKNELSSLKGLLLGRRQFPPVPQTTPILPSWQLPSNIDDTKSNLNPTSCTVTKELGNISQTKIFLENPAENFDKLELEINFSDRNRVESLNSMNTTGGETDEILMTETGRKQNEADTGGLDERFKDTVIGESPDNNDIENPDSKINANSSHSTTLNQC